MASNLKVIFLFLWLLQCRGENVKVQQIPPIQVVLLSEGVSIPCKVTFPYMSKYTKFSITYHWINSLGQNTFIYSSSKNIPIPPGQENKSVVMNFDHSIIPLQNTSSTGTYYCTVKWSDVQKMGEGVFVLARGTGYIDTTYNWEILIILTVLLAALSITATALLLWKRKVVCQRGNRINILGQKMETQPPPASPSPPPPIYDSSQQPWIINCVLGGMSPPTGSYFIMEQMLRGDLLRHEAATPATDMMRAELQSEECLDVQNIDVYSVLEDNTNNPSPKKSPPKETWKKQATLGESSDTVYENI